MPFPTAKRRTARIIKAFAQLVVSGGGMPSPYIGVCVTKSGGRKFLSPLFLT